MKSPVTNKASAIFIPVSDLRKAIIWYSFLLGLEVKEEYIVDHLYILPMDGTRVVLDEQIFSEANRYKTPAFHFDTNDIQASYRFITEQGIELLTEIENGHWFNFKDPDGNALMICQC